jgi:hypothetical protein
VRERGGQQIELGVNVTDQQDSAHAADYCATQSP